MARGSDEGQEHLRRFMGEQQIAGDVLPMAGEKSMGSGATSRAADYATGKAKDPQVISIGRPVLKDWVTRQTG